MDFTLTVNGVKLNDYVLLLRSTAYRAKHEVSRNVIELPNHSGSINPDVYPVLKEATYGINVAYYSESGHTVDQVDDMLQALFTRYGNVLQRTFSDGRTDMALADLIAGPEFSPDGVDGGQWSIGLALPDVWFQLDSEVTVSASHNTAIDGLRSCTGYIYHDTVYRLNRGTSKTASITDALSGTGISYADTNANSDKPYLYIDPEHMLGWISANTDVWDYSTLGTTDVNVSNLLSYPANGRLTLVPKVNASNPFTRDYTLLLNPTSMTAAVHTRGAWL